MIPGALHHGLLVAGALPAFNLTSAAFGGGYGYDDGNGSGWNSGSGGVHGAVSPSPAYINAMQLQNLLSNGSQLGVWVYGTRVQSAFTSITINGVTFYTATLGGSGGFFPNSILPGFSGWVWAGSGAPTVILSGLTNSPVIIT